MNFYIYVKRAVLSLILLTVTAGCKTSSNGDIPIISYSAVHEYSEEELLSGEVIFGQKLADEDLPDVAVITLNQEMEDFLDEYVMNTRGSSARAKRLANALFDQDKLGMTYDASQTFTSIDAFGNKVGNCLAFSYLYSAFAKKAGLNTSFQEVEIPLVWNSGGEDFVVGTRHVNVVLSQGGKTDLVIDINRVGLPDDYKVKPMRDDHAVALYYGNMGSSHLLDEQYELAFKYISKALRLAPQEAPLWTNLGVLYRRVGLDNYAERAHFIALDYDIHNRSALSNLSFLYRNAGDFEKEKYFQDLADRYQLENPSYRYFKAKEAYEENQYVEALDHINNAIRKNRSNPKFYTLQGDIYRSLGDIEKSERAIKRAQSMTKT